ncbi:hypothetical protein Droror1_Dr00027618 [Drosera rotundifolia]
MVEEDGAMTFRDVLRWWFVGSIEVVPEHEGGWNSLASTEEGRRQVGCCAKFAWILLPEILWGGLKLVLRPGLIYLIPG